MASSYWKGKKKNFSSKKERLNLSKEYGFFKTDDFEVNRKIKSVEFRQLLISDIEENGIFLLCIIL